MYRNTTTYKTIFRPMMNYAALIFALELTTTNWKTSEGHLHTETNILPAAEHSTILHWALEQIMMYFS